MYTYHEVILYNILECLDFDCILSHEVRCGVFHLSCTDAQKEFATFEVFQIFGFLIRDAQLVYIPSIMMVKILDFIFHV
jgi:hypothetical protein